MGFDGNEAKTKKKKKEKKRKVETKKTKCFLKKIKKSIFPSLPSKISKDHHCCCFPTPKI